MKKYLSSVILFAAVILGSCVPEDKVEPAEAPTFVRYFNGGNSDQAQQVIQSYDRLTNEPDGFIILATTEIRFATLTDPVYKIKLIKTDLYGNQKWQRFYPQFAEKPEDEVVSYKGNNLITLPGNVGYVIVGEDIQNNSPKMMLLKVDDTGENILAQKTLKSAISVRGVGVAQSQGAYWAVGSIVNSTTDRNMVLAKFGESLDSLWSHQYGAGSGTLAPRLFINNLDNAYWGGTIQKDNTNTSVRFVKVQANSSNTGGIDFDLPLSRPENIETGNDFCQHTSGFAVIGTTNKKENGTGDVDILFKRVSENGTELSSQSFPVKDQDGRDLQQNETGNSLCTTKDGGFLLLGTIDTQGEIGRGDKDYYLIKIDAFGVEQWRQDYGSKFEDNGVNVIQASDGGYVVLGTSSIGRVKTIMLMKTDGNGKIR